MRYILNKLYCGCGCCCCRYAKKQVLDESGTLQNLLQLWQLVVRHPDVFYESRAQFMIQMVNTLSRIGMPTQV
jgi:transformation/transcription domain-associated protein